MGMAIEGMVVMGIIAVMDTLAVMAILVIVGTLVTVDIVVVMVEQLVKQRDIVRIVAKFDPFDHRKASIFGYHRRWHPK